MSDIPAPRPGDAAELRASVAQACADLDDIRETLADTPDASALDALTAAVRDGTQADRAAAVEALDAALRRAGDAVGLPGAVDTARHWGADRSPGPYGGAAPGYAQAPMTPRPAAVVFLCPTDSCSRRWVPTASEPRPPACDLAGAPLRWERL
ncbi:hypothetical protein [Streptomyces avicenniae]|uniref:hypothetical protein n=1 Tax=Streptomyces avicenniae TaxID=500153 RepID=UPI0006994849|nr:hypothetical protein [Streptomyces avicenniae]